MSNARATESITLPTGVILRHVRINVRPAAANSQKPGAFKGDPGTAKCGAPITANDLTLREVQEMNGREAGDWVTCPACRAKLGIVELV